MGVPPPLAELRGGVGLSATIFFAPPHTAPPLQKRISAIIPNASPRTAPACADYAERERLHCEAIIPNASPRTAPACVDYAERERLHCEAIIPNAPQHRSVKQTII
ncbi:MAG: hypothetical protein LBQ31_02995 [Bacteroidales bacterium]|nr:hypothetical protein [Bacteroidales bacterium]